MAWIIHDNNGKIIRIVDYGDGSMVPDDQIVNQNENFIKVNTLDYSGKEQQFLSVINGKLVEDIQAKQARDDTIEQVRQKRRDNSVKAKNTALPIEQRVDALAELIIGEQNG